MHPESLPLYLSCGAETRLADFGIVGAASSDLAVASTSFVFSSATAQVDKNYDLPYLECIQISNPNVRDNHLTFEQEGS
jgi:hypothetical protein